MGHSPQACTAHRPMRWIGALIAAATVAAVPAIAPPLTPEDVRVTRATHIALTAQTGGLDPGDPGSARMGAVRQYQLNDAPDPLVARSAAPAVAPVSEQQQVLDDFRQGGLALVILHQFISRTTDPAQLQIINDFYQGGVYQSEAHRFLQLFTDPQQQQFLKDFVTGGLIQVVRNRLLDATSDPGQRAAIIAFFPDEVTDYRGGPLTVLQRRLIAAAKGNEGVIAVVNAVFDNPVLVAVRAFVGGGPIFGTPLDSLPPLPVATTLAAPLEQSVPEVPEPTVVEKHARVSPAPLAASEPAALAPRQPAPSTAQPESSTEITAAATTPAPDSEVTKDTEISDVIKTGNKVEPTIVAGVKRPKSGQGSWGIFGQVAEAITNSVAAATASVSAPTGPAAAADASAASDAGG